MSMKKLDLRKIEPTNLLTIPFLKNIRTSEPPEINKTKSFKTPKRHI